MAIYYTYQHAGAWEAAKRNGFLFGDSGYGMFTSEDDAFHRPAYDWLADQYEQRTMRSLNGNDPVWLSDTPQNVARGGFLKVGEPGVVLTVELPDEAVLALEAGYWVFALNQWFLSFEDREAESEEELRASWEKMFDREWCEAIVEEYPETNTKYYYIVDRIQLHHVLDVQAFIEQGVS